MVTRLTSMKAKQELLVANKTNANVFNTMGTMNQYRSRSAGGNSTHRSTAFQRAGSEDKNLLAMMSLTKNNSISGGFMEMKAQ